MPATINHERICLHCQSESPAFRAMRSLWYYEPPVVSRLIISFKHADQTQLADFFARWLWQTQRTYISACDVMIPVPIHASRLWKRMYNQATLLCHALSALSGCPTYDRVLHRKRATPSLGQRNRAQRRRLLRGAFVVRTFNKKHLANKKVLLVDDVMTTGQTLHQCARTLKRAGANEVYALVIARHTMPFQL